jgi:hypothetical protein
MSIKINPKNKGKFTASAKAAGHSVQEHAKSVLNDPNASPLQKKRANFARNAKKWKHQDGGVMAKDSVDNNIMLRQLYRESRFKEKAVSPAGAQGLAQLRPITVKELKNKGVNVDPMKPKDAIVAHKTLMTDLNNTPWIKKENQHPDVTLLKILGGYNMGRTGLINLLNNLKKQGKDIYNDPKIIEHFPKETRDYFHDISGKNPQFEKEFKGALENFKFKGAYPLKKKANGGIIKDNRGQWAHPGKPTQIQGGDITMKGVGYPVLGVSDKGQSQLMKPNKDYKFPGANHVNEFPMMKHGGAFSMGSAMNPKTGDPTYFFKYSFPTLKQPKAMNKNSSANLGNAYTQQLINKLRTFKFKSGGTILGNKPSKGDVLKRGVDLGFDKLYPLPFKCGGKMPKMQKGGITKFTNLPASDSVQVMRNDPRLSNPDFSYAKTAFEKNPKFTKVTLGTTQFPDGSPARNQLLTGYTQPTTPALNPYGRPTGSDTRGQLFAPEPKPLSAKPGMMKRKEGGIVWGTNNEKLKSALKLATGGKIMNKHLNDHVDPKKTIVKTKFIHKP